MTRRSVVLGVGSALPSRRVSNEELAETVETSDAWIVERTGIRSRYIAADNETTASLATDAARRALDHAGVRRDRHRSDRARHGDARPDLPLLGDQGPGRARDRRLRRLRRARGVHRLPLCAVGRRFDAPLGQCGKGAGDRIGDLQPDPRLGGPRDLRPVRRRCGRAGAERRGERKRDPRHAPPRRRPAQRFAVRRRRALDHRHGRQAAG